LLLLEGLTEGLLPWVTLGCPGCPDGPVDYHIDLQRWHGAEHGALLGVLFAGALIGLLWRARQRPLLLQFYALGHAILLIGYLPVRPAATADASIISFSIGVVITTTLLAALFPTPRQLFSLAGGRFSPRLFGAAVASALALAPVTLRNLQWQLSGFGGEHAEEARWMGAVILAVCLVLAALLTSSRRPGWQVLGAIISLAYVYLGVAAITVPDQPGSWGVLGGLAAIIGGLAYAALIAAEAREARPVAALRAEAV
jgi:hypothetical protein